MTAARPAWDFDYRPATEWSEGHAPPASDLVVALDRRVPAEGVRAALAALVEGERAAREARADDLAAEELLARQPLFWWRVTRTEPLDLERVVAAFRELGASVRYVAPARIGSQGWAPAFAVSRASLAVPSEWAARASTTSIEERDAAEPRDVTEPRDVGPREDGRWFLSGEGGGVAVARAATGTGAGTRLAVIDDDAAGADALDLDAEVLLGLATAPRAQSHGAQMVGWAAGAARASPPFRGVAPGTSPRLYLVPKPGLDVVWLPRAIVRAVSDGADVVVCATYIEGCWSPMLDDALAFAERIGRGGRGAIVVLPTGRETSSPPGSVHASLTLSFADPAADPRVLCVAPAARAGGWFFYRDRRRLARPFANRGPSVRALAPGDDIAWPLGGGRRLCHAESSGASAIAAGVVLLVIAANPMLRMSDVFALLETTADDVPSAVDPAQGPFADPHDTRPAGKDADGHNAKHGYGALNAERACLAAADPVAWALVRLGELEAARAYATLRRHDASVKRAYSVDLARWMVCVLLADARASHAVRALVRHLRLLSSDLRRARAFAPGAFARQLALALRGLLERPSTRRPPAPLRREIDACLARLAEDPAVAEQAIIALAPRIFVPGHGLVAPARP